MGNFLPLIEAFIAFALTMLALATAVSSVFGGIQRAKRSHARGMREMMKYYYRNEVHPFLAVQGLGKTTYEASFRFPTAVIVETEIDQTALIGYGSEARKILKDGLTPSDGTASFDTTRKVVTFTPPTPPKEEGATEPQTIKYRVETDFTDTSNKVGKPMNMFLVDMTQLPIPTAEIEEKDKQGKVKKDADGKPVKIQDPHARERLAEKDDFRSLGSTVDNLTDEEFTTRLRASEVGRTIADTRSPAERDLCYGRLLERFRAHSGAATERFTRRARLWTVILGFLLAFLMNIDSINLLSRYLRDDDLVKTVLQNTDKIVEAAKAQGQTAPSAPPNGANPEVPTPPPGGPVPGGPVQAKLAEVDNLIGELSNAITETKEDAEESQSARIQEANERIKAVQGKLKNIKEMTSEAQKVAHTIDSAVAQMTEGFPVGWNLYPNCVTGSTATRCVRLANLGKISPHANQTGFVAAFCNVMHVAANDFGGFSRWFLGVLITGIMAGLGAPFWMEVVNNFLRARNLINNSREPGGRGRRPV